MTRQQAVDFLLTRPVDFAHMIGFTKFWELLRDTAGQKPVEKVMIADVDQSVIDEVEAMVNGNE